MSDRRGMFFEAGKNVLIVLLSCSALFFGARVLQYSGITPSEMLTKQPQQSAGIPSQEGGSTDRPIRMAVVNENGRYGVQYDTPGTDRLFDELGGLLGEALGLTRDLVVVDREQWEAALDRRSIYYEFPAPVALPRLAQGLLEGETSTLTATTSKLLLAQDEDGELVRLYYEDEQDGAYYACRTGCLFRGLLEDYIPNGAFYAFHQPERYGEIDRSTMILPDPPAPPVYQGSSGVNLADSKAVSELMQMLEFSSRTASVYPSADGWSVRDGEDTLRLTGDGTVVFHAGEGQDRYPLLARQLSKEQIWAMEDWVRKIIVPYCGAARVCLSDVQTTEHRQVITYSYTLSGAEVWLGQEGWCAKITIQNGKITEYTLRLRNFVPTEHDAVLLPEYQAMAAMQALGVRDRTLLLCYYEGSGSMLSPSWVAR